MKKILLLLLWVSSLWSISAEEIIKKSDAVRNVSESFYQRCFITEYIHAKKRDTMLVSIYSKIEDNSGQYRTLVKMLAPKKDHNKLIMRDGDNLWFYDPNAKASIRISPQQRLLGQSSNGDVMSSNFALDYESTLLGEEAMIDGDKKSRNCYLLRLKAKSSNVSYPLVDYWVDKESFYPVRSKFYTATKKLLKDVYYRKFKDVLGVIRPTEVLIFDGFDKSKATKMQFANAKNMEIPDFWFRRDYLPKFLGN